MKSQKIISLCLVVLFSICLFCACTPEEKPVPYPQVIATDKNGNEYTEEIYSYYAHYTRDMMETSFMSSSYYYYFNRDFNLYLESYVDEEQTQHIYDYAVSIAKSYYEEYLVIEKMFSELHLVFDEDTQKAIDEYLKSFRKNVTQEQLDKLCTEVGISEEDMLNLLVYHSYKAVALQNYYCGEGGDREISEQDIRKYYNENYYRFRYVALSKYGADNKKLGEGDLALLSQTANTILQNVNDGADFSEYIKTYSAGYLSDEKINQAIEEYKKTNEMTEEQEKNYREALAKSNDEILNKGMICDQNGIYDYAVYTSSGYTVEAEIVAALKTMELGQYSKVETDGYIWVIEKRDINESKEYAESKSNEIRSTLASAVMDEFYSFWIGQLKLTYSPDVLAKYDPRKLSMLSWS